MQQRNLTIPVDDYRIHFDAVAGSYLLGRAAGYVDLPEMAAIDVALIRSDDRERFVARDRDVFNFKFSGCQRGNRAAFGRDRIDVRPAVSLGHEQQPIARDPLTDIVAATASIERI